MSPITQRHWTFGALARIMSELLRRLPDHLAYIRWLNLEPSVETSWPRRLKYQRRPERWLLLLFLWREKPRDR